VRRLALVFVLGLALVLGGLLAVFALQPTSYRVARTRTIAAQRAVVIAHIADVRALAAWAPFHASPGTHPTLTFSPSPIGVGAWMDQRDTDGSGARSTITSMSADAIELRNETLGAFGGGASTQRFGLRDVSGGTEVTWSLSGDLHGLGRALWPLVHLEADAGRHMEEGLERLDQACR